MPLSIKDPEADRLARALSQETGEILTQAVVNALRERVERKQEDVEDIVQAVMEIGKHCVSLPVHDARSVDELLGYDANGLP
jgi:antitoxin VapB